MSKKFVISCIDYRFPDYVYSFLEKTNHKYYNTNTAGASLPISYHNCRHEKSSEFIKKTNDLKTAVCTNLEISFLLSPVDEIIIINHQDCGAFKYFLPKSGYPQKLGQDNKKELEIQLESLLCAGRFFKNKYPMLLKNVYLQLIDINGTLAQYNEVAKKWQILIKGHGNDSKGLFFSLK